MACLTRCSYIDPTLEHDLTSPTKPWALSPLISTMPYFAHSRRSPQFPGTVSLVDKTEELHLAVTMPEVEGGDSSSSEMGDLSDSPCSSGSGSPVPSAGSSSTSLHSYGSKGSKKSLKEALKKASLSSKGKETTKREQLRNTRLAEREKVQSEVRGLQNSSQRRSYFASKEKRQRIEFGPQVRYCCRSPPFRNQTLINCGSRTSLLPTFATDSSISLPHFPFSYREG